MSNLNDFLSYCANVTEEWLSNNLVEFSSYTSILTESMRYSVFAGGKRLRPALMFASYNIFSENILKRSFTIYTDLFFRYRVNKRY